MSGKVFYEWDVEEVSQDEYEDVLDHDHQDHLSDFYVDRVTNALLRRNGFQLVLVRDRHDGFGDLVDRSWAYVEDMVLPERFDYADGANTGAKVPERFRNELARLKAELLKYKHLPQQGGA